MLLFIIGGHVNFLYPVIIAITKKLIIPERDSERITPIVINRTESSVIIFPCFPFTILLKYKEKGIPIHKHTANPAGLSKLPFIPVEDHPSH